MPRPSSSSQPPIGSLVLIAAVVAAGAAAFAYTAGWFSPGRLTPTKLVDALAPPAGPSLGHRRNHAKGICFTGEFEANGAGSRAVRAQVFARGQYPVLGRFNLATADANAPDATVRVRGMGMRISTPDGQEWRSAMIDLPFFRWLDTARLLRAAAGFEEQGRECDEEFHRGASGVRGVRRIGPRTRHGPTATPKIGSTASTASSSWTMPARSTRCAGRCCRRRNRCRSRPMILPSAAPITSNRRSRSASPGAPQRWTMVVTIANPGDPTADPSKAWPEDRRTVEVGTLVVQQIEAERDGPCRDINFDPTVLPTACGHRTTRSRRHGRPPT